MQREKLRNQNTGYKNLGYICALIKTESVKPSRSLFLLSLMWLVIYFYSPQQIRYNICLKVTIDGENFFLVIGSMKVEN